MVLVYLPTKLGDFVRANVGVHIPAPWFANLGLGSVIINQRILKAPSHGDTTVLGNHAGFKSAKSHVCCIFETVQLYFLT